MTFTIQGRNVANADDLTADFFPVTPDFFATMKIAMLRGRDFTDRDAAAALWVAIVNETMARRFFPGEKLHGKHIRVDLSAEDQQREIVAVVKDIPANHPQSKQDPAIFIPFVQAAAHTTGPNTGLHLQITFPAAHPGRSDERAARGPPRGGRNRSQPAGDRCAHRGMRLAEQEQYPRYYSMLLGLFAVVATGLAAVGIYGVMAYVVEQRTREIGIRMALGAGAPEVLKLIVSQVGLVIASGAAVGLAGAMALTRFLS